MTSLTDELVEGVEMKFGRKMMVIPPLTFKQLRLLRPQLSLLSSLKATDEVSDEVHTAMMQIVHTAVRRNYPNVSIEEIEDSLDLANRDKIIRAVMGVSGLIQGEGKPATN